jgi:sulfite exporter TauE/SafE
MFLLSAFLVGLLGSFHCIGMCGPIALALPFKSGNKKSMIAGRLLYNAGRIFTYSVLGLIFGFISHRLIISGLQKNISIIAGSIILLFLILSLSKNKIVSLNYFFLKYTSAIKNIFRKLFGTKSTLTLFLIGTANGLLPCGFVYIALAAAATTGNFLSGMSYMLLFGAGTLPVMLSLSLAGNFFGLKFQPFIRKSTPWVAAAVAVFLIYRGIMIEPQSCCHQH